LYEVTGRQRLAQDVTEEWLDKHYPNIFKDVILTNSFTPWEIQKSHMCNVLGIDIIVDDSHQTCMNCLEHGIHPINYIGDPVYPWCHVGEYSEKNWKGVHDNIRLTCNQ